MVAVRAIAAKELTVINTGRTIGKEILAGAINGLLLAIILTFIVGALFSDLDLGAVFATAIIINMVSIGCNGTKTSNYYFFTGHILLTSLEPYLCNQQQNQLW